MRNEEHLLSRPALPGLEASRSRTRGLRHHSCNPTPINSWKPGHQKAKVHSFQLFLFTDYWCPLKTLNEDKVQLYNIYMGRILPTNKNVSLLPLLSVGKCPNTKKRGKSLFIQDLPRYHKFMFFEVYSSTAACAAANGG